MTKPYSIILDEPCAGMDPGARANFLASLRRVGGQKKMPLIYVAHHIEEILPLSESRWFCEKAECSIPEGPSRFSSRRCPTNCTAHPFHWFGEKGAIGRL